MTLSQRSRSNPVTMAVLGAALTLTFACGKNEDAKPAPAVDPSKVQMNLIAQGGSQPESKLTLDEIQSLMRVGRLTEYKGNGSDAEVTFFADYNTFSSIRVDLNQGYGFTPLNSVHSKSDDSVLWRDDSGNLTQVIDVTAKMAQALEGEPKSSVALLKHGYFFIYNDKGADGRLRNFSPGQGSRCHKLILNFLAERFLELKSARGSLKGVTQKDLEIQIDDWMDEQDWRAH